MRGTLKLHIPISLITTCFALFFFVFEDMGIRMIYLYAFMGLVLLLHIVSKPKMVRSRITMAFLFLSIVTIFWAMLPYALHSYDVMTLVISITLCALLALVSKPDENEVNKMLKVIVVIAFAISVYVIIVSFFPNLYINYISKFIDEKPRVNTIRMLRMHYGVMIGGNVTLINHILVLSLLIIINKYFIYGYKKHTMATVRASIVVLIGLCAMLLENRKGELLVFILVFIYALCFGGSIGVTERVRKTILYIMAGVFVMVILFTIANKYGLTDRYLKFVKNLMSGDMQSAATGRLTLWNTAINLFKENPVVGIGWGNTRQYISMFNTANQTYIHNVHCVVLQLLCETGVIGCVMFMTPVAFIIRQMKKTVNYLRKRNCTSLLPKLLASVALEYQWFLLLNGLIDSTWHRISFWPFYAVSIIMAVAAQRFAHENDI